ncbi:hypothetical protein H4S02_000440 [Coemansia sp. RSA 2611]|nr:hypothetical protein LPJ70_002760 [Coemansia sp. RSA 2708]KAJ2367881.1 hypothetical protein H4S01_001901 [Coemansia sp. RSA 2610]KAJ2393051.1 hypothetical protein H4S02_000440 [Coemansia sp. RSA 2611]
MSSFVLRYFPIKARAEVSRLLLLSSGAKFEDVMPDWPAEKEKQPMGQLPVLVETAEDGSIFELSDSIAIEKYLAAKFGLLVQTGLQDTARENQLRSQVEDLIELWARYIFGTEYERESVYAKFKSAATNFVKYHEKILAENGSNGHYFGSKTTYMDLCLFAFLIIMREPNEKAIPDRNEFFSEANAPGLNKVFQTVQSDPVAAAYVASLK